MAYTASGSDEPRSILGVLKTRLAGAKEHFATYRRKREIYLRTLSELRSYRPHELRDLRIQADDIEELARKQAGW
jgi:hypothetical protein